MVAVNMCLRNVVVLFLVVFLAGCVINERYSIGTWGKASVTLTGMLVIVDPNDCAIREGCGPKYRLMNETFSGYTVLIGDVKESDDQLLITVNGQFVPLPEQARLTRDYRGREEAIEVKDYEIHTKIKYRSLLVDKASQDSRERFGCNVLWDKQFSWALSNGRPILVVRLANIHAQISRSPFIELAYDGRTGALVSEKRSKPDLNPCLAS